MNNEEKSVGVGLHVRDLSVSKGVTKDNAEIISLIAQQSAMEMAAWKDEQALNAYCDVSGHYHHTVPNHICRLDCEYYSNFKNKLKGGNND